MDNANKTKVVVTGASGLLGRALMRELSSISEYSIIGLAHNRASGELQKLNLHDVQKVKAFMTEEQPSIIIHAAAERKPDICEGMPEKTRLLNVEATQTLVEVADKLNAWILYISTDYVFDGTNPPYATDSITNPLNIYGQSKRDGELAIMNQTEHFGILRIPILYGDVEILAESSVTSIAESIQRSQSLTLDHWGIRYPTLVDDVAVVCRQMMEFKIEDSDFNGIYHWSGNDALSKFDMATIMAEVMDLQNCDIKPDSNEPAGVPRPRNCQLDCSKLKCLNIGRHTPFRQGISNVLKKIKKQNHNSRLSE